MFKNSQIKGYWWIPDNPKEKVQGTLNYTLQDGIYLDIIGYFGDITRIKENDIIKIIHGLSTDNTKITIFNSFAKKGEMHFPGTFETTYLGNLLLLGEHIDDEQNIKFKEILIKFSNLEEWVNIYGFEILIDSTPISPFHVLGGKMSDEFTIHYKNPSSIVSNINNEYSIEIAFNCHFTIPFVVKKELNPKQSTRIIIRFPQETNYSKFEEIIFNLQNFFTLGISQPVYPLEIIGITEKNKIIMNNQERFVPIKIIFRPFTNLSHLETKDPHEMLFTYADILTNFREIIKNWLLNADKLKSVYNLYFAVRYNSHLLATNQFLNFIQALETYCSIKYENRYIPHDACSEIYRGLIGSIPEREISGYDEFKQNLKVKLRYINEYSLRTKVKTLIKDNQEVLSEYIGEKKDFIDRLICTRNYLTHYSKENEKCAAKDLDLIELALKTRILVEVCLLNEAGLTMKEIKELFSRNREYRDLKVNH